MSELSTRDIEHLARLSRLNLSAEERERFAGQLSSVVEYIEHLQGVDTSHITELKGVTGLENVLAEDIARPANDHLSMSPKSLLKGVPRSLKGMYQVRAVLTDEVTGA